LKKPSTYEPINPDLVGAKRRFVLGKHVGFKAVKSLLEESGFKMGDEQSKQVFNQIKFMGDKGKRITSVDLDTIAESVLGQKREKPIKLLELTALAGNKVTPNAMVKLQKNGDVIISSGTGTGPVDAALNAIKAATDDVPFELSEYHVDSISGGTDAVVRILVKLNAKGRIVTAEGAGSDIVLASVDAMINGINSIIQKGGR
jgi:(R)-citramalate synthase